MSVNADGSTLVEVRGVTKRYGRTLALDDVSLDIVRGERYAVLGPNGAGKTTLIHILCTILQADSGSATIDGHEVRRHPRRARQRLGVVFQEPSVDTRLTVQENLDFHGRIFGVPAALRRRRIDELLDLVELGQWRGHLVRALSKGMQRRLEIARALVHDAALLVLDEATAGLDAQSRSRMWQYLSELQRQRAITVLMTTHYIEEADTCERVCVVDHGKVLTVGSPVELKERHGRMQVRIRPRDEAAIADLRASVPGSVGVGDSLVVPVPDEAAVERLLADHGPRLRAFSVERPTLESVFLDLTGRGLRDAPSSARDALLATPRSGGEPVR